MTVRRIEDTDIKDLIEFNVKTYYDRDKIEESFKYRYLTTPFKESFKDESLIALNKEDKIIGQALLLPSRLTYKGKEYPMYWGMDYFVEQSYRGLSGVVLVKRTVEHENHFGVGLTEVSLAVHLAAGERIAGYMKKYIKLRLTALALPFLFLNFKGIVKSRPFPESLKVKKGKFVRVYNPEEIVSKAGYWNPELIEFSRSKEFINWRFFHYKNKYIIYKYVSDNDTNTEKPTYFVVRPVVWRKLKCLLLVDYRHPDDKGELYDLILKAAKKLTRKTWRAASITGCSLPSNSKVLKKNWFVEFGTKLVVVSKFPLIHDINDCNTDAIHVTFADSDCDFYYGNNRW